MDWGEFSQLVLKFGCRSIANPDQGKAVTEHEWITQSLILISLKAKTHSESYHSVEDEITHHHCYFTGLDTVSDWMQKPLKLTTEPMGCDNIESVEFSEGEQ